VQTHPPKCSRAHPRLFPDNSCRLSLRRSLSSFPRRSQCQCRPNSRRDCPRHSQRSNSRPGPRRIPTPSPCCSQRTIPHRSLPAFIRRYPSAANTASDTRSRPCAVASAYNAAHASSADASTNPGAAHAQLDSTADGSATSQTPCRHGIRRRYLRTSRRHPQAHTTANE